MTPKKLTKTFADLITSIIGEVVATVAKVVNKKWATVGALILSAVTYTKLRSFHGSNPIHVQGVTLPQNYLAQPNNLESALDSLDLKGLLVLNGLITQQALKLILASEGVMSKLNDPMAKKKKAL